MSKNETNKSTKTKRNKRKAKPENRRSDKNRNTEFTEFQPDKVREVLLSLLHSSPQKQLSLKQILKKLQAKHIKIKALIAFLLEDLTQNGNINKIAENYQIKIDSADLIEGVVDFVSRDFAYIMVEGQEQDVWVSNKHLNTALDGDTVKLIIHKFRKSNKPEGEVVEIVKRARTEFVGRVELSSRFAFVIADHKKMFYDIFINLQDIKGATHGDKVIAQIAGWDERGKNPVGKIVRVLGKAGEHETEMNSIMAEYSLPVDFPQSVLKSAEKISEEIPESEIRLRRDFRKIPTFTIDPFDAKDFDDALSIRRLENENWEIGVHIADVTHYVKPDTILDREALERGTSVYLVDRVVPMLPEKLSNHICSLRPYEDKLTFSAVFEMAENGRLISEWFGKTIINSHRRFAYEEAQEVIETGEGDFVNEIQTLNRLALILQKNRYRSGAISFETVEVKFKLDKNGRPLEIVPKVRKDAHKLIEEFMLLANKRVAEFVYGQRKGKIKNTMVYRTHDAPDEEKLENLKVFAKQFGYELDTEGKNIAKSLNKMAIDAEGKAEQNVLQNLAIRTMAKAKYTSDALPHYGLAFKHYSHFTSPIRRYPDVLAHRLLEHYLAGGEPVSKVELEQKCKLNSEREKRAADAERASIKYKQVELMQIIASQNHPLHVFEGIIVGVTEWGLYVEITETKCEGMVRLADIQDDYYEFDEKSYAAIGARYKRTLRLGDKVKVRIKATNLEKRVIDLLMA
jgi:ribonuclease R